MITAAVWLWSVLSFASLVVWWFEKTDDEDPPRRRAMETLRIVPLAPIWPFIAVWLVAYARGFRAGMEPVSTFEEDDGSTLAASNGLPSKAATWQQPAGQREHSTRDYPG